MHKRFCLTILGIAAPGNPIRPVHQPAHREDVRRRVLARFDTRL